MISSAPAATPVMNQTTALGISFPMLASGVSINRVRVVIPHAIKRMQAVVIRVAVAIKV